MLCGSAEKDGQGCAVVLLQEHVMLKERTTSFGIVSVPQKRLKKQKCSQLQLQATSIPPSHNQILLHSYLLEQNRTRLYLFWLSHYRSNRVLLYHLCC